ncbi:hypothetical protein Ddye_018328 [Dipteronia dyeriana]|uniref:Uncharacterized protein n=1 Tax=Dipteronia dyeriana TaxID=168575 RepID=A0AAD9UB59_9ROSI|nr:hypothetical protein Ddye_018328 [Dipteronia dyeriana]
MKEDDNNWPEPDRIGWQELEIVWEMNISHSPLRRLVLSLMFRAVMIQKGFAYFIILFSYMDDFLGPTRPLESRVSAGYWIYLLNKLFSWIYDAYDILYVKEMLENLRTLLDD